MKRRVHDKKGVRSGDSLNLKSQKVKALTLARLELGESVLKAGDTELH